MVKLLVFVEGCDVLAVGEGSAARVLPAFFAEGHHIKLCAKSENTKQKVVAAAVTLAGGATITAAIGVTPHASKLHALSDKETLDIERPNSANMALWAGAVARLDAISAARAASASDSALQVALTSAVCAPLDEAARNAAAAG